MVEIDEYAVFPMLYLRKFRDNLDIVVHYGNNPFWISADTNKDDLDRRIHLKVRLADGTLDVRM